MAWPYDQLGLAPQQPDPLQEGDIMRVLGSQAMMMHPDEAMDFQPPQIPLPDDFASRLALSGIQFGRPGRITSKTPGGGLAALLGLAGAFGNYKVGKARRKISDIDRENAELRDAATRLANRRHQQRQQTRQIEATQENLQSNEALRRDLAQQRLDEAEARRLQNEQRQADLVAYRNALLSLGYTRNDIRERLGGLGPGGEIVPKPRIPTTAELEHISLDDSMIRQINRTKAQYSPDFVGPLAGRRTAVQTRLGGAPPGAAQFRQSLNGIRNHILKLRSGGAVTEPEAARLNRELPMEGEPDQSFIEKMDQFEQTYREIATNRRNNYEATGVAMQRIKPLPGVGVWRGMKPNQPQDKPSLNDDQAYQEYLRITGGNR